MDPKRLRAFASCDYIMSVGVGLKEKEKNGGRGRERPPAYSLADLKCVLSRAIFSWGNGQKSCRNTADKRKKWYTLICHYNMPDCLLNEDDSVRPSFSLFHFSFSILSVMHRKTIAFYATFVEPVLMAQQLWKAIYEYEKQMLQYLAAVWTAAIWDHHCISI